MFSVTERVPVHFHLSPSIVFSCVPKLGNCDTGSSTTLLNKSFNLSGVTSGGGYVPVMFNILALFSGNPGDSRIALVSPGLNPCRLQTDSISALFILFLTCLLLPRFDCHALPIVSLTQRATD